MLLGGNWKKSDGKFYSSIGVNNLFKTLIQNTNCLVLSNYMYIEIPRSDKRGI